MFQKRFSCAFCGNHTIEILDYGTVALAGGFLKPEQFATEEKYPLSLHFCERCYAVQIPQHIPPEKMFSNYFYFTSATNTMRKHFVSYANEIVRLFNPKSVVVWGAGHQALAVITIAKISENIRYIVDSAPFKQEKYTPASHILIKSPDYLLEDTPEAVIVMAAGFSAEVISTLRQRYGHIQELAILGEDELEILD